METTLYRYRLTYHDVDRCKWVQIDVTAQSVGAAWAALLNSQLNIDEVNVQQLGPAPRAVYLPAKEEAHV